MSDQHIRNDPLLEDTNPQHHASAGYAGCGSLDSYGNHLPVHTEQLRVFCGEQSGARIDISDKLSFTVGSGYDNDVVLRCREQDVRLQIKLVNGQRYIELLDGSATIQGEYSESVDLMPGDVHKIPPDNTVSFAEVSFTIENPSSVDSFDASQAVHKKNGSSRSVLAIGSMAAGIVLLAILGLYDAGITKSGEVQPRLSFANLLENHGIAGVRVLDERLEDGSIQVKGRVDDRSQFKQIQQLVRDSHEPVDLDVQIDSVLQDAVADIYRNHGIAATVDILGNAHVKVETVGVSEETLQSIEAAIKTDLPMLEKMEALNMPAVEIPEPSDTATMDPEKEVAAVVAGDVSYVITRDQARYFIGAILPSGHTITSISEGTVVMQREGEETTLRF